jgi:polyhydroxybutyrate depolymerase
MNSARRPWALASIVALALATTAACSSVTAGEPSVTNAQGASSTQAPGSAPAPTGGACAPGKTGAPGQSDATVAVPPPGTFNPAGDQRAYRIWVPANYSPTTPAPVIVNYHGTGGTPEAIDAFSSNLSQKANARGYIVVAPQALSGEATTARWVVPGFGATPDDVAMTRAMLAQVGEQYCVDPKRIYATGFSSGGAMSTFIACRAKDLFAGVAPGGGVNLVDPSCNQGSIPMFAYHGTADDVAFYNGIDGNPTLPNSATAGKIPYFGSVEKDMDFWATVNGCQAQRQDQNLAPDAILRTYPGCVASTQVLLAVGGGHTFPGGTTRLAGPDSLLGATVTSVNMADLMLNWFDTQKLA